LLARRWQLSTAKWSQRFLFGSCNCASKIEQECAVRLACKRRDLPIASLPSDISKTRGFLSIRSMLWTTFAEPNSPVLVCPSDLDRASVVQPPITRRPWRHQPAPRAYTKSPQFSRPVSMTSGYPAAGTCNQISRRNFSLRPRS
jgi:hypothetical protein